MTFYTCRYNIAPAFEPMALCLKPTVDGEHCAPHAEKAKLDEAQLSGPIWPQNEPVSVGGDGA